MQPAPRQPIGRLLLALLIAATFFFGLLNSIQNLAIFVAFAVGNLPEGLTQGEFYTQATLFINGVYVLAALAVGPLLSRLGYNRAFLIGAALSAAGVFGLALTPGYTIFLLAQGLLSAGGIIITLGAILYLLIHGWRRLVVWLPIAGLLGGLIGNALVAPLFDRLDSASAATSLYIPLLLTAGAVFAAFALTRLRWRTAMPSGEAIWYYNPLQTLRDPRAWPHLLLLTGIFLLSKFIGSAISQVVSLLGNDLNTAVALGTWIGAGWLGIIVGRVVWGGLVEQVPAARLVLAALVGTLIGAVPLWFAPSPLIYAGIQLFIGAAGSLALLHALDRAGVHHLPGLLGLSTAAAALVTPLLLGLWSVVGGSLGLSLALALAVGLVTLLSGAAWWWSQQEAEAAKKQPKILDPNATVRSKDHITEEIPAALRGGKGRSGMG
jgi:hypothetical protein